LNDVHFWLTVLFCNIIAGIAGFGGNILALPFLSFLAPLSVITPVLLVVALFNNTARAVLYYKYLRWDILAFTIGWMLVGAMIGGNFLAGVPEVYAKLVLAVFAVGISLKNLYRMFQKGSVKVLPKSLQSVMLFCAGTFQFAFACGGPFLAVYLAARLEEKNEIRAMQMAAFLIISILGFAKSAMNGGYTPQVIKLSVLILPALLLAVVISEKIVKRVDNVLFKKIVYLMLLVAGSIMGIESLGEIV